jgi:probable HAF family extracellular repeat protein
MLEALESRTLLSATTSYAYTLTDLGSLGGGWAVPSGINASGQISGNSMNSAGSIFPVIFANGKVTAVGPVNCNAVSINDSGEVVGLDGGHPAIYLNGKTTVLPIPFAQARCRVYKVNDSGLICGVATLANGHFHAFIYNPTKGTFTDLGTLGGSTASSTTDMSYASSINASGQAEGDSVNAKGLDHAFIWTNGKMVDLGTLGGPDSSGDGINNLGHAVGTAQLNIKCSTDGVGYVSPLFFYNGTMHNYGTLGGDFANANGINNHDVIVGYSMLKGDQVDHAFVCTSGVMTDLNTMIKPGSGWTLTSANGINDAGQIIVTGTNAAGQTHAFVLNPVKVTATPATLAAGQSAQQMITTSAPSGAGNSNMLLGTQGADGHLQL